MTYLKAAALVVMLVARPATAQQTKFDFDKTADFGAYKTYELRDGTKVGDPVTDGPITAAIEAQLVAKGLTKADKADIAVVYHFALDRSRDLTAWSDGSSPYAWHWGGEWDKNDVRLDFIYVGTLVIDIADLKRNAIVWRGIGKSEINPSIKPERRDRNIRTAIEKIMRNYPPKKKK